METKELTVVEKATKKVNGKKVAGIVGTIGALAAVGGTIAYKLLSKNNRDDEETYDEDSEDDYDEEEEDEDVDVEVEEAD